MVYTWAFKGLPRQNFGALVYTSQLLGAFLFRVVLRWGTRGASDGSQVWPKWSRAAHGENGTTRIGRGDDFLRYVSGI